MRRVRIEFLRVGVSGFLFGYQLNVRSLYPSLTLLLAINAHTSLCTVLLGRVTHDHAESMRRPTQAVGSGRYESYNNNNVYVVRHTALVLPCYVRVSVYS